MRYLLLIGVVLSVGCSSPSENRLQRLFEANKERYKALQMTEKFQLMDENGTVRLFVALSYLYDLSSVKRGEVFSMLCYDTVQEGTCDSLSETIRLNGKLPLIKTNTPQEANSLRESPFTTEWRDHYRLVFPNIISDRMKLDIYIDSKKAATLNFSKTPKYLE